MEVVRMLIEFKLENFRSFRDEASLSMEATGLKEYRNSLTQTNNKEILPSVAIFGKNGGGKSNIIRGFWLGAQFIKNAQKTQHEKALIPVNPFSLNDYSNAEPTGFEYDYISDGIRYVYGFKATREIIVEEYLHHYPKKVKAVIFDRKYQDFRFPEGPEKKKKEMIMQAVAANQLFFSIACTMNYQPCIQAMKWFREELFFSQDYPDIPQQLLQNADNANMLSAITEYAKEADLGILDMSYEFKESDLTDQVALPDDMPEDLKTALRSFMNALAEAPSASESKLTISAINATSYHDGIKKNGERDRYPIKLSDESDGTKRLMALAPAIERTLSQGGVLIVDELEKDMHPILMEFIISKFQSKKTNLANAQLIFTTHNTELLNMELLRKDQLYFVDKDRETGASELYCIKGLKTHTSENIQKSYLKGKYGATPDLDIEEVS
jgi:hypothetical protein